MRELFISKILYFIPLFIIVYIKLYTLFIAAFKKKENLLGKDICFSVIVAVKNESNNIPTLVESINNFDYPSDKFEIILVDDNSKDNTKSVFTKLIKPGVNYSIIDAKDKIYEGKKGALNIGIKKARHPFILITDADCRPPNKWLQYYAQMFKEGYGFIIGVSPFINSNTIASDISCFENLRSAFLSFAIAKEGFPYNAAARNIGFTKEAFDKVSGYKNTTETISGDDDLLLREMVKYKIKTGLLTDRESFVYSTTKNTLPELFTQRGRHTTTSFYYSLPVQIILGFWHLLNLLFLFSPLFLFINKLFILPFIIKLLSDVVTVLLIQKKFNYKFGLYKIPCLQICYECLLIISFFRSIFFKNIWK